MTLAGKMCTIRSRNPCGCVLTSEVISLPPTRATPAPGFVRSEEHTSELQSQSNLVCRLLLEKKKNNENVQHANVMTVRELLDQELQAIQLKLVFDNVNYVSPRTLQRGHDLHEVVLMVILHKV